METNWIIIELHSTNVADSKLRYMYPFSLSFPQETACLHSHKTSTHRLIAASAYAKFAEMDNLTGTNVSTAY